MRGALAKILRSEGGGVAVVFAAVSMLVLGVTSAGLDIGALVNTKAKLQDLSDAASLYAVREITISGTTDSEVIAAVEQYVLSMSPALLPAGVSPNVVTTVISRDPAQVSVRLTANTPLPVGVFIRNGEVAAAAQSIETVRAPVSLLVLNRSDPLVWTVSGTSDVVALDGVAHVNSTSSTALRGSGNAKVQTKATLVAGPSQNASNWTPAPNFGAHVLDDPWAGLMWPTPNACDHNNLVIKKATRTLQPGVYCGGITLTTHAVANLEPGVYVLKNGDLDITSGSALRAPSGVTLVLLGEGSKVHVQAGAEMTISAPKTGPWANMAIAAQKQQGDVTSTLIGGAELQLDGVVYLPSQTLAITGGGAAESASGSRIFVVDKIAMQGNGKIILRGDSNILSEPTGSRLID